MRIASFSATAPGMIKAILDQTLDRLKTVQASVSAATAVDIVAELAVVTERIEAWVKTHDELQVGLAAQPEGAPLDTGWDLWMQQAGILQGNLNQVAQKIVVPSSKMPSRDEVEKALAATSLPVPLIAGAGVGYLLGGPLGAVVGAIAGSWMGKKP